MLIYKNQITYLLKLYINNIFMYKLMIVITLNL
jgi:hypothetical protein